jgi:tetratricopeptide (TPR) repeat protein
MTTLVNIIKILTSFRTKVVIIMVLELSFSLSAYSQEILWEKLNSKVHTLSKQRRYSDALSVAEEALKVAEDTFGPDNPKVAISLNNIAELYVIKGTYAEIEPLYKRALEINEKALGSDHPDVAISLNNLAELYYNQGRYTEAEPLYKRALKILEDTLGSDHPEVAITLENMKALYKKIDKDKR